MHNESLKPTRNSPGIFARSGGRAAYLKRYAKMVKMILLVESSIRNNWINQFGGK
jgi:hypothetical protein